jgi:hypothetical protein
MVTPWNPRGCCLCKDHQLRRLPGASFQNSNEEKGSHNGISLVQKQKRVQREAAARKRKRTLILSSATGILVGGPFYLVIRCSHIRGALVVWAHAVGLERYKAPDLSAIRCERQVEFEIPLHL